MKRALARRAAPLASAGFTGAGTIELAKEAVINDIEACLAVEQSVDRILNIWFHRSLMRRMETKL